jgi:hypothetical protein
MIRREIQLAEDDRRWLLISQVDHAHVSGELTRHWNKRFSKEVVEGISHHDDGWAGWEAAPKINPTVGGPYSFLEMPLEESLVIWDGSIAAAQQVGPLAGFIVAGHFYNLLNESEQAGHPAAVAWLAAKRKSRTAWLDEWVRLSSDHTMEDAKRAQDQLLTADLFSLWMCCDAPVGGEAGDVLQRSPMKPRLDQLLDQFKFSSVGFGRRRPTLENPLEALAWIVGLEPWPFDANPLSLVVMGESAPVAKYENWPALKAVSQPVELRWRLIPAPVTDGP